MHARIPTRAGPAGHPSAVRAAVSQPTAPVEKVRTGIPGLDHVAERGLPRVRATLVAGTAGSAKTVFAAQFLAAGIRAGEGGVFVTVEDSVSDLRRSRGHGLGVAKDLAALLGADLRVDSQPGRGSTFTLRVPALD